MAETDSRTKGQGPPSLDGTESNTSARNRPSGPTRCSSESATRPGRPPGVNEMTTNKASSNPDASDNLRDRYGLDYARSRPNRFASRMTGSEPGATAATDSGERVHVERTGVVAMDLPRKRSRCSVQPSARPSTTPCATGPKLFGDTSWRVSRRGDERTHRARHSRRTSTDGDLAAPLRDGRICSTHRIRWRSPARGTTGASCADQGRRRSP